MLWEQEVPGSNPGTPTEEKPFCIAEGLFCFEDVMSDEPINILLIKFLDQIIVIQTYRLMTSYYGLPYIKSQPIYFIPHFFL